MPFVPKQVRNRFIPTKSFENYIVTFDGQSPRAGLTNVDQRKFTKLIDAAQDDTMARASLGFNMLFDETTNVVYQQFIACANGWICLVDPAQASSSNSTIFNTVAGDPFNNAQIKSTFSSNSALICAWFDDLYTAYSSASQVSGLSAADQTRVNNGTRTIPNFLNPWEAGVWYAYDIDPTLGLRRTIVRWLTTATLSNNDISTISYVLKFEVVFYENGRIELRYPSLVRPPANAAGTSSATTGIFMPGSAWRFRDVCVATSQFTNRAPYKYGGYVSSSFLDGALPYVNTQSIQRNWPGRASDKGVTITFQPPLLRKKVLPRNRIRIIDSQISRPLSWQYDDPVERFDDRRAVVFLSSTVVNYPTSLQRFHGDFTSGISERQELFFNDFETTGSAVANVSTPWLQEQPPIAIEPFSEAKLHEQGVGVKASKFCLTGSGADELGTADFKQPLSSKTQIKLSFPINFSTTLLATTASVWYYDTTSKSFQCPAPSDLASAWTGVSRINEDGRAFGAVGNRLASGSNALAAFTSIQSDNSFGNLYEGANPSLQIAAAVTALSGTGQFSKSIHTGSDYYAPASQSFRLPITRPFLIEKAIVEFPVQAGPGWFNDITTTFSPGITGSTPGFDFGGPAVTLSLFNQFGGPASGPSNNTRELIMSGVFTHNNDMTASYALDRLTSSVAQLRSTGFLSFASQPAGVVTASAANQYTGSVVMLMDAAVQNGVLLALTGNAGSGNTDIVTLINQSTVSVTSLINGWLQAKIAYIEPFGRMGTGFVETGRSLFGRDKNILTKTQLPNPLYLPNDAAFLGAQLGPGGPLSTVGVRSLINATVTRRSPYVVMPGDNLVLALSKTRSVQRNRNNNVGTFASGATSFSHDIIVPSGAVYMTLYGSYVTGNAEWHEHVKQPLASDAIHLVIGDEPIFDQMELENRLLTSGGYNDDLITGSLFSSILSYSQADNNDSLVYLPPQRGRAMSHVNPRGRYLAGNAFFSETLITPNELAGLMHVVGCNSPNERMFDSMVPRIDQIVKADGASVIFRKNDDDTFYLTTPINSQPSALIFFDVPPEQSQQISAVCDYHWSKSFPFEPRYSGVTRVYAPLNKYVCDKQLSSGSFSTFVTLSASVTVDNVLIKTQQFRNESSNLNPGFFLAATSLFSPVDAIGSRAPLAYNSSSVSGSGFSFSTTLQKPDDLIKTLFGTGNASTVSGSYIFGSRQSSLGAIGNTNAPDYGSYNISNADASYLRCPYAFGVRPIIRGWKYGLINGLPQFSKAVYRRGKYGQFRDMLEQRIDTKFFYTQGDAQSKGYAGVGTAAIKVLFVNASGSRIDPSASTQSQNLSFEATSSVPYVDGLAVNR